MRVLITGCSSGFNLGAARLIARRGHEVFATVRNPATATELRDARDSGLPIHIEALDVRDGEQAHTLMDRIVAGGGVDALVNNAGASIFGPVEATSIDQMRDLMEVNLFGPMRLIQLALPHMRSRRQGRIINVSSLSGIIPLPYVGLYGATKHAFDAMSFSLAAELREFGIKVTIITPSGFKTSITDKLWEPAIAIDDAIYAARTKLVHTKMSIRLDNDPAPVFQLIANVLEDDNPTVRHLIGANAVALASRRRQISDDEWVEHMVAFQNP
jgi:NAD(P)-dependent dehydrogenase (short-subunit alcohol dehydrogenase family)